MKLYEINEEIAIAESQIELYAEEHEGDITGCPFNLVLDELGLEKDKKLLSIGAWIKNLKADEDAIKRAIDNLKDRKKSVSTLIEKLKGYIAQNLPEGEKLKDLQTTLSWRSSKSVELLANMEVESFDDKYLVKTVEVSKTALMKDLKSGIVILGAAIKENQNIQIK